MDLLVLMVQRVPVIRSLLLHLVHQTTHLVLEGPKVRVNQQFQASLRFLVLQVNPRVLEYQEVQSDLEHRLDLIVHLVRMVQWRRQVQFRQMVQVFQMIQQVPLDQMDQVHQEVHHFQSAQMVRQVLVCLKPQCLPHLLEDQLDLLGPMVLERR